MTQWCKENLAIFAEFVLRINNTVRTFKLETTFIKTVFLVFNYDGSFLNEGTISRQNQPEVSEKVASILRVLSVHHSKVRLKGGLLIKFEVYRSFEMQRHRQSHVSQHVWVTGLRQGTAQRFKSGGAELQAKRAKWGSEKIVLGHAFKNIGKRLSVRISGLHIAFIVYSHSSRLHSNT